MKHNRHSLTELRKQAEASLNLQAEQIADLSSDEVTHIVHELHTHQIELEMQNEELRRAQEELVESRDDYADLYDFAPVGYVTVSNKGLVLKANLTFADLLGKERRSLFKERFSAFVVSDDQDNYYKFHRTLLENQEKQSCELRIHKEGDDPFWGRLDGAAVQANEDEEVQLRLAITDINARKRAEEEKKTIETELRHVQKMDTIGQLAAGVAHEFNNLLVVVRGNAELLIATLSDLIPEQSLNALKDIEQAGARAYALTSKLLSFAYKKSSKVTVLNLDQVVTDSYSMFVKPIGSDIALNIVPSSDMALVYADEDEIKQVILNLVLNARDAMPRGGAITIRTHIVTLSDRILPENCTAGSFVELSVSDDGCGMTPVTSERIFEPFYTTKPVGEGTGLGLSIAYSDISKMGGFIKVDSRVNVGTVVSVFLPLSSAPLLEATVKTPSPPTKSVSCDETILVCDDEESVSTSIKYLLESVGYSVIVVNNAADTLAAVESHDRKISLLLTDVTMPGMNGIELGREINKRYPDMKVLHQSGYTADHIAKDDSVEVLPKGGPVDDILQRIRQILDDD